MTVYDNSSYADDPNAGSFMDYHVTNPMDPNLTFYKNHNIAAVDIASGDWDADKYHYIDVNYMGTIGRVEVWDGCANADCDPADPNCCTNNRNHNMNGGPGFLIDVETVAANGIWGIVDGANHFDPSDVSYRICGTFDPSTVPGVTPN
jgi:hypothetical protein